MVGDGDATAAPLADARVQPKLHAAPSSGTAMAPFAGDLGNYNLGFGFWDFVEEMRLRK